MTTFDWSSDEEQNLLRQLNNAQQESNNRRKQLTPQLASTINDFTQRFPAAPADAIVAAGQAYVSGQMSENQVQSLMDDLVRKEILLQAENSKKKHQSWFERNVAGKIKTGWRWVFAVNQLQYDLFQNATGKTYSEPNALSGQMVTQSVGPGWFSSTLLGTMLGNQNKIGSGWFPSQEIYQEQGKRAREYRGEIDGHAVTPGRIMASYMVQPGTPEYNFLSGLTDMAINVRVPSTIPRGTLKRGAQAAASVAGLRTAAGLTNYETPLIVQSKVEDFLNSRSGQQVVEDLTKIDSYETALEKFGTSDPRYIKSIVEIKDKSEMRQFISDTLGRGPTDKGFGPTSINDFSVSKWSDIKGKFVQFENPVSRMMQKVGGREVILSADSTREQLQSLKNVRDYLRNLRVSPEERNVLLGDMVNSFVNDNGSGKLIVDSFKKVEYQAFKAHGFDDQTIQAVFERRDRFYEAYDNALHGYMSSSGKSYQFGGDFLVDFDGGTAFVNAPMNTAVLQSEMLKKRFILPDPRRVRRMVSKFGWITKRNLLINPDKVGELNIPLSALDFLQNDIWKNAALLTGGYAIRNISETNIALSVNPLTRVGLAHPLDWIRVASFKKLRGDIFGRSFKGADPETVLQNGQKELAEVLSMQMRQRDPLSSFMHKVRLGIWKPVNRAYGPGEFESGLAAELALLHTDEAARLLAQGNSVEETAQILMNDHNKTFIKDLQSMWGGREITLPDGKVVTGSYRFIDDAGNVYKDNLLEYLRNISLHRLNLSTGQSEKLKNIVGFGEIIDNAGKKLKVFTKDKAGRISGYADELSKTVKEAVNDPNLTLNEFYKVDQEFVLPGGSKNYLKSIAETKDHVLNSFFGVLYPRAENIINRSPGWRKIYWKAMDQLLDELQPGEIQIIARDLQKAAAAENKAFTKQWLVNWVGDNYVAQKIIDLTESKMPPAGKLTAQQIGAYASGFALDEIKRAIYNASEKSNFADILRFVFPFGSAWSEVVRRWVKTLATDPAVMYRTSKAVQAVGNMDPDADGKGFFYKDPNSGNYYFTFPFANDLAPFVLATGGALAGLFTMGVPGATVGGLGGYKLGNKMQKTFNDVNVEFQAPAASLNMALQLKPGMGPYVQVLASWVIGNRPKLDWMRDWFMPYGTPQVEGLGIAPAYLDKMIDATKSYFGKTNLDGRLGDLMFESMRAAYASGKYDIATPEGQYQLKEDSEGIARNLLMLEAFAQFIGPVRPQAEFIIPTKQGDIPSKELSKLLFDMREADPKNYVGNFLDAIGEDGILFLSRKTKNIAGGLDPSKEFSAWERQNGSLFDKYPDVAGYFGPTGSSWDYRAQVRYMETNKKRRSTPTEFIADAQYTAGSYLYRQLVREAGPNPNNAQEKVLAEARKEIGKRYPGFANSVMDVNKMKTVINQLYFAVNDPGLDNNPIAEGLRTYLMLRDQAIAVANSRGLTTIERSAKTSDLRATLRSAGEAISNQIPEFERLWSWVLFNEVDVP